MPEPRPHPLAEAGDTQHAPQRRPQQAVLGDVLGVLVVSDLERHRKSRATRELITDPDTSPHGAQGVVGGSVSLEYAVL